jgi:hypothetical protein
LSEAFHLGVSSPGSLMMPAGNDPAAHDQNGPHRGIGTRLAETTPRFPQGGSHKELVLAFRGHASGISAPDIQRNRAIQKRMEAGNIDAAPAGKQGRRM